MEKMTPEQMEQLKSRIREMETKEAEAAEETGDPDAKPDDEAEA